MKRQAPKQRASRHDSGFTLLEMMVALVVFGLVMAGIAQSFQFGLTAWNAASRRSVGPENLAAMDAALTRMIGQAVPGSMAGKPGAVAFTTRLPAGAGLTGLADVAIMAAPDGTVLLRYAAHPPGTPLIHPPAPWIEVLAQGVSALKFSYLVAQANGGPPAWTNEWPDGGQPLLVRIHLDFTNGRSWPDLVAAPVNQGS
jgi:general secretion pathway protein J